MIEPTTIMDRMGITDPIDRLRLLSCMECILMAAEFQGLGATTLLRTMDILSEVLEDALKGEPAKLTVPESKHTH